MSLAVALRRNLLKRKARRLFVEIKAAPSTRFRGPDHARRLARIERDFHSTMAKLAEVDPAAAKLLAEVPCSTCGGTGEIDQRLGGIATSGIVPCPDCKGTP